MSTNEYFKEHLWAPIVVGVGGAVALIAVVAVLFITVKLCCRYWKRTSRNRGTFYANLLATTTEAESSFSYGSITMQSSSPGTQSPALFEEGRNTLNEVGRREMGLYEAMEHHRRTAEISERETALLTSQFYLRNSQQYTLLKILPDLGSRMHKYWFLVSPVSAARQGVCPPESRELLMALVPTSKQCPIRLQGQSLNTLNGLLKTLQHPYIHPIREIDFIVDKQSVTIFQHFIPHGSLKDLIYKAQPDADWSIKYSVRRKGLPMEMVSAFGRQVLEALLFLYSRGFPLIGHVHSGNIFTNGKVCRLSGYENTLLGYHTRSYKFLQDHLEHIDTIMFGHLIFEMSCGCELTSLAPTEQVFIGIKQEPIRGVLSFIFGGHESGKFPSIQQVAELPFFQQVQLPELADWRASSHAQPISSDQKILLRSVRQGQSVATLPARGRGSQKSKKLSRGSSAAVSPNHHSASQSPLPPPLPPKTKPLVPPRPREKSVRFSRPPSSSNRAALLSDIRRGKPLKTAITDDRSAPRI